VRNKNKYVMKHRRVLSLMTVYLLVVVTHIFVLPRILTTNTHCANSIFKRKLENRSVIGMENAARAVLKKTEKNEAEIFTSAYLSFHNVGPKPSHSDLKPAFLKETFHYKRYSYLSFCIFRI